MKICDTCDMCDIRRLIAIAFLIPLSATAGLHSSGPLGARRTLGGSARLATASPSRLGSARPAATVRRPGLLTGTVTFHPAYRRIALRHDYYARIHLRPQHHHPNARR